jgi:hypothetical protein
MKNLITGWDKHSFILTSQYLPEYPGLHKQLNDDVPVESQRSTPSIEHGFVKQTSINSSHPNPV